MRRNLALLLLACVPALVLGSEVAHAKPMFAELKTVVRNSDSIVIAEFVGPVGSKKVYQASEFILDVKRTVRGTNRSGQIKVKLGTGHPDVSPGTTVVAFIDAQDRFSFVAEPLAGHSIASGALMVRGFYDFNAYFVGPSLVSLAQLERFVDTGTLEYRFRGAVHVLSPDGSAVVPTRINLDVRYDWATQAARVKGFPRYAKGFAKPTVRITSGWGFHVTVIYRGHWPRPLEIGGTITGVDKNGAFETCFHVTEPDLLTAAQLRQYLKNKRHAYAVWHYRITLDNGRKWKMSDGHSYGGNTTIVTDRGDRYQYTFFTFVKADPKQRHVKLRGPAGLLRIDFGPRLKGALLDERGTLRQFHQELLRGPLGCTIVEGDGKGQSCGIEMTKVVFEPAIKGP